MVEREKIQKILAMVSATRLLERFLKNDHLWHGGVVAIFWEQIRTYL